MIKAWKKVGQTPLDLINELRDTNPALKNETMSYAGRLDPMAEGETLILVGEEENKNRESFMGFDKEYEADILFGFSTDSYDLLGLVTDFKNIDDFKKYSEKLEAVLKDLLLKDAQKYPSFSSKTVQGKPLFEWYKSGRISEIKIPERQITIKKADIISLEHVSSKDLLLYIEKNIKKVPGDFRQEEIIAKWREFLSDKVMHIPVLRVYFSVTSGTYIRSLANEIGDKIGVPACLFKLKRTKVINEL